MIDGHGVARRGHPILAVYVGDYPEQILVTGSYTGTQIYRPFSTYLDLEHKVTAHVATVRTLSSAIILMNTRPEISKLFMMHWNIWVSQTMLKPAAMHVSSPFNILSGKISRTSTYSSQSHPIFYTSYTRASSNTLFHGLQMHVVPP